MRRLSLRLTAALTLAAGCGRERIVSPETVPGTYVLQTVNEKPLPYTFTGESPARELLGDQIVLVSGGSFTETSQTRTAGVAATAVRAGTYTLDRSHITLRYSDQSDETGAITESGDLNFSSGSGEAIYRKQ
jgi:hypothetical protein